MHLMHDSSHHEVGGSATFISLQSAMYVILQKVVTYGLMSEDPCLEQRHQQLELRLLWEQITDVAMWRPQDLSFFLSYFILFRFLFKERRSRAKIAVLTDVTPCVLVDTTFWKDHTAPIIKRIISLFCFNTRTVFLILFVYYNQQMNNSYHKSIYIYIYIYTGSGRKT